MKDLSNKPLDSVFVRSLLLALAEPLRKRLRLKNPARPSVHKTSIPLAMLLITLAAVYGGYFGAGLSVIILAVLGSSLRDSLTRLNALKQTIAFAANIAAAIVFVFSGQVVWLVAVVMAICALLGGAVGGKLAGRLNTVVLRWVVVIIGLAVSVYYFLK